MKKLFLHIGAGKTGSSALQLWLNKNHASFKKQGVYYPINNSITDKYAVTSGNGVSLFNAIQSKKVEKMIDKDLKQTSKYLLYSSEAFQNLNDEDIKYFKHLMALRTVEIVILMYVRDVYNVVYSGYQQLIKRHNFTKTYKEFALSLKNVQQFRVLALFEKHFPQQNIILFHYDTEKEVGIENCFALALNLHTDEIIPMGKEKVNRSLTVLESEILRNINIIFHKKNISNQKLLHQISDSVIVQHPETDSEILFLTDVLTYLEEKYVAELEHINRTYFSTNRLKFFNHESSNTIVDKVPFISDAYIIAIDILSSHVSN